jgi:hypothetical protein
MMYRNSRGIGDKRIPSQMWPQLEMEVKDQIIKEIDKHQRLPIKGRVVGFKAYKI